VSSLTRRDALKVLAATSAAVAGGAAGCEPASSPRAEPRAPEASAPTTDRRDAIVNVVPLGFPWRTIDPFLFCVHHDDRYPAGNEHLGPAASLAGRAMGQDFEGLDGWRMYHGARVPGFPQHPHRGFETVTIVRRGLLDHADSRGAAARYGRGDVQWLTAGKGILHSEMFPLLRRGESNPVELFQIWLNLPRTDKMVDPHFTMLWSDTIPTHVERDEGGRATEVTVIAGPYGDLVPPRPPPSSWASRPNGDVAIWAIRMDPRARCTLPAAAAGSRRALSLFLGSGARIAGRVIPDAHHVEVRADATVEIEGGPGETEMLLLQGRPLGEPVARHGPFVMNSPTEIDRAFTDYRRTQFGGWPWDSDEPVHGREPTRFARHADGRTERRG
jgi:hypothetical protein